MITSIKTCETAFKGNLLDKFKKEENSTHIRSTKRIPKTYNESFDEFNKSLADLETHIKTKPWRVRKGFTLLSKTLFLGFVTNMKF